MARRELNHRVAIYLFQVWRTHDFAYTLDENGANLPPGKIWRLRQTYPEILRVPFEDQKLARPFLASVGYYLFSTPTPLLT
jgi:hypothetical protein